MPSWQTITLTLLRVMIFIVLRLVVGRRVLPWLLWQVAQTRSRELFTLAVVSFAICIVSGRRQWGCSGTCCIDPGAIADAAMFVVTVSDPLNVYQMVNTAQTLNPAIEIVIRSSNEDEAALLKKDNLGVVFYSTEELARNMMQQVLEHFDR